MTETLVKECIHFETCKKGLNGCVGCNIWNYVYDAPALIDWCKKQDVNIPAFTMEIHKQLKRYK